MSATGRASRLKMRSRPIDVNKPLQLTDTSQREAEDIEFEAVMVRRSIDAEGVQTEARGLPSSPRPHAT